MEQERAVPEVGGGKVKYRNTELQCVSFPPVQFLRLHPSEGSSVPVSSASGGTELLSVFSIPCEGSVSLQAAFNMCFLGLDVSSSSRRPVCLMCHRNVYSEGGVP